MPQPSCYSLKKKEIRLTTTHKHPNQHLQTHNKQRNLTQSMFSMKQDMPKPLSPKPLLNFSYQLPKIFPHFQNKKSLMKPDTFDFKSLPASLLYLYPLHHVIISPRMLLNRKTQKTVFIWRSSWRWNKAELRVWFIQLFT